MTVSRLLDGDAGELLALVRHVADAELAPFAVKSEEAHEFPRDRIRTLGAAGLLGMPHLLQLGRPDATPRLPATAEAATPPPLSHGPRQDP